MRLFPFYHHFPSPTNTTETMGRNTKTLRPRIQVSSGPAPAGEATIVTTHHFTIRTNNIPQKVLKRKLWSAPAEVD